MALILVVDDSWDNLMLMEQFLNIEGHSCRLATSGKMALSFLETEKFHLIISDYQMAEGNGIWLLEQLKKKSDPPSCIVVTSDLLVGSEQFIKAGAAAYLQRPIIWEQLKMEIDHLI